MAGRRRANLHDRQGSQLGLDLRTEERLDAHDAEPRCALVQLVVSASNSQGSESNGGISYIETHAAPL